MAGEEMEINGFIAMSRIWHIIVYINYLMTFCYKEKYL